MSKFYNTDDIIKLFQKQDDKIEDLECLFNKCCEKVPINIGSGIGLFNRLYRNKWEFKSLIAGSNITITDNGNDITINSTGGGTVTCEDIDTCLGISALGASDKYLNEQGDWQTISSTGFITAIADTSSINLSITGTTLSADFVSNNISQFTNDVPYLTGTTGWLTTGNTGTNSAVNYLGTTDNQGLTIKTFGVHQAFFGASGGLIIGQTSNNVTGQSLNIGSVNNVVGNQSLLIGISSSLTGDNTFGIGNNTTITANNSFIVDLLGGGGFLQSNSFIVSSQFSGFSSVAGSTAETPTATLHVDGTFRYVDGTQGISKVLTSDALGNASWQTLSSGSGTVTSVAALTLGTTGTDLSSSVANSTTTPVITLNVPTASATNRGALSSTDWSTFNGKQDVISLTTIGTSGAATFIANTLNIPQYTDTYVGTVTSVGLSMPSAFTVTNSPVTSSGTLTVTGAGTTAEYIRGDGSLATFPSSTTRLDQILAATTTNTIANANNAQVWAWDTLTTQTALALSSSSITTGGLFNLTSTSVDVNSFSLLNISSSGANANATRTAIGGTISVTNTGTTSTNTALTLSASGATNNYGLLVTNGNVGIGTTTPTVKLHVAANDLAIKVGDLQASATSTYMAVLDNTSGYAANAYFGGLGFTNSGYGYTFTGNNCYFGTSATLVKKTSGSPMGLYTINGSDHYWTGIAGATASGTLSSSKMYYSGTAGSLVLGTNAAASYAPGNNNLMVVGGIGTNAVTTSALTSTLQNGGSFACPIALKTANYTLTSTDHTIIFDGTSLTATLPAASTCSGREYVLVNRNATSLTTSIAFETLTTGVTSTTITSASSVWIQSNGTSYYQTK